METNQTKLIGMVQSGLNLISQAISIHDRDLRLVHGNQRFQDMFQLPDDLIRPGTPFRDTLQFVAENGEYGPVDDIDSFVDEKVTLALKFEPHYFERTRANGTSISIDGVPLAEGGWITVYTDITELKRDEAYFRSHTESLSEELVERSEALGATNRELSATVRALETAKQELTESRERIALINRMTPAHIAHVDAQGRYTHSNGRLSSIIPIDATDIVGQTMHSVLGDDLWAQIDPNFAALTQGEAKVCEIRDDRSGQFIRLAMSPDIREDGVVAGAFILSTDVTDEVSARTALAHSRRRELASQLTSAMAHDFSNLLTIIMGQQARLEALGNFGADVADISETIKSAAKRGAQLIDNLNQISPQRTVEPSVVGFAAFVDGFTPLAQAALPDGMSLEIKSSLADERLIFDPGFAQDALLNLVINAAEACEGSGQISLAFSKSRDGKLEFLAQDTGPGFSPDALQNALKPFYSTKGGHVGRGLGLTSAYDFAKSCGGHLKISNRAQGGAQIHLKIPYQQAKNAENGMVLLVDDDPDVRKTVRGYLRCAGHMVIEAETVEEAGKLLSLEGLCHVVTDLDLGASGTGLDVAALVPSDIPVLIITGLPSNDQRRQRAQASHRVLSKPFDYDALAQALSLIPA